jgi:iron complex outermembrane receptor protein
MRGFGAAAVSNTLILLDGRRLNDVDMAAVDFSSIPLKSVERVEIIRGGAGSLYGDGAVGGAINIITKKHGSSDFNMSLSTLSGSYETKETNAAISQNIGAFSYGVSINEQSADNYRDNNELRQQNLGTNFLLSLDQNEFHANFANSALTLRLPGEREVNPIASINQLDDDPRGTNTPNDWADQTGSRYSAGYTRYFGDVAELILDFGGRNKKQSSFFDPAFGSIYTETTLSTTSATPRLRYHFRSHSGTIGYDIYNTEYESGRTNLPNNIDNPIHNLTIDQESTAAYFHHTSTFAEAWTVSAGARTQTIKLDAEDDFNASAPGTFGFETGALSYSDDFQEKMYDLGARYVFNKSVSTFYNFARAVRFATVDDLYEYDVAISSQSFSPLEPQTSSGHTLGIDYVMRSEGFSFKSRVAVYLTKLKNEIHFNPSTFTNDNLDPTERSGAEIDLRTNFGKSFSVNLNYTNTRAVFRDGPNKGNHVPLVPTHTAGMKVVWKASNNLTFSVSDKYIGEKRFDNDQENTFEKVPAYEVVDVKATGNFDGWIIEAAVYNRFNEKAYDYGIRSNNPATPGRYFAYPLAGRTATLSVGKDF